MCFDELIFRWEVLQRSRSRCPESTHGTYTSNRFVRRVCFWHSPLPNFRSRWGMIKCSHERFYWWKNSGKNTHTHKSSLLFHFQFHELYFISYSLLHYCRTVGISGNTFTSQIQSVVFFFLFRVVFRFSVIYVIRILLLVFISEFFAVSLPFSAPSYVGDILIL